MFFAPKSASLRRRLPFLFWRRDEQYVIPVSQDRLEKHICIFLQPHADRMASERWIPRCRWQEVVPAEREAWNVRARESVGPRRLFSWCWLELTASLHKARFRMERDQENESIFEMTCRKRATETKRSRDSFGPGLTDCAPAFGVRGACSRFTKRGQQCWRWQTAGKPDAFQTLRGPRRHLVRRASIRSAFGLRLNAHNNQITCGGCPSWLWIDQ